MDVNVSWLPSYTVKKHPKAKYVSFRASQQKGIVITVPTRFNLKHLPAIIEENKTWLLKQLAKFETAPPPEEITKPNKLLVLDEEWTINYELGLMNFHIANVHNLTLTIFTKPNHENKIRSILINWLKSVAEKVLTTYLLEASIETNLSYNSVKFTSGQHVWGTCNYQKRISLNYKLVMFPIDVIRYVIIHELCHTKHMNHSGRFWGLVAKFDPEWKKHRKILSSDVQKYVPLFISNNK